MQDALFPLLSDRAAVTVSNTCHAARLSLHHRYAIKRRFTQGELLRCFGTERRAAALHFQWGSGQSDAADNQPSSAPQWRLVADGEQSEDDSSSHLVLSARLCSRSPQVTVLRRVTRLDVLLGCRQLLELQLSHAVALTLAPGLFPSRLCSLRLPEQYNAPLPSNTLPTSLRHLVMGGLNQQLDADSLPAQLTHLSLDSYDQPLLPGVLPTSLDYLCLGHAFNQPIVPGALPAGLGCLVLGVDLAVDHRTDSPEDTTRSPFKSLYSDGSEMFSREFRVQRNHWAANGLFKVVPRFNQPLVAGALPASLRHLTLPCSFGQELNVGVLPPLLESMLFESDTDDDAPSSAFHQPLHCGVLPATLRLLCLPGDYNEPLIPGALPSSLTYLDTGETFNQLFEPHALPAGLRTLRFASGWKHSLSAHTLPALLTDLHCTHLQQPLLRGAISGLPCLKTVTVQKISQCLFSAGCMPASLTVLDMSEGSTSEQLPLGTFELCHSLTWLHLPHEYSWPIQAGLLPRSLQRLSMPEPPPVQGRAVHRFEECALPASLSHLRAQLTDVQDLLQLPPSLQRLALSLHSAKPLPARCWPDSLSHLHISDMLYNPHLVRSWAESRLVELSLDDKFDQPLRYGCLPHTLRRLYFDGSNFQLPLERGALPDGLLLLHVSEHGKYNQPIEPGVLPASLLKLVLRGAFARPLARGTLPDSLKSLTLGHSFRYAIAAGVLPPSLQRLCLEGDFQRPAIADGSLPVRLRELLMSHRYRFPLPNTLPASLVRFEDDLDWRQKDEQGRDTALHNKSRWHTQRWMEDRPHAE